jgi:hypothetical protein
MRDDRSSTEEPRTPVSATSSAAHVHRRVPLPAVKGTMGGIGESGSLKVTSS